jgi:hypothetical protein
VILISCPSNVLGQPTDEAIYADRARIQSRASIGTATLPTASSLRLDGLLTSGATDVLLINSSNEVVRRILGRSDLPSAVAYEDEANTFSLAQVFSSNVTISGNLVGGLGSLFVTSPTFFTGSTVGLGALGASNVRIGVNTTSPRIILEDVGSSQWEIDNVDGLFRIVRMDTTGTVYDFPLRIDSNIAVQPPGRRIVPMEPYGVDLGSQQFKFGALWVGDAFFDRLVTIENMGTVDNRWLVGNGNALDEDLSPSATTMITRYNNYVSGTFIYLQKFARTEFIKTTSGASTTNLHTAPSFETGSVSAWSAASGIASIAVNTAKSYHGETSMLVDANANPSTFFYNVAPLINTVQYTTCFYARRTDGAVMADGAVQIWQANAYVDAAAQPTQTDGWYRFCRTSTASNPGGGNQNLFINTKGVDMYIDAVQTEMTATQRPFSEYRASYSIVRNQEGTGQANQWYAGDGMFSVGAVAGDGWIDCYALRGIKSATEQGPGCVVNVRTGSSYNSWGPRAAWGNLNGLYGYGSTTYGFAAGDSAATFLTATASDGVTIWSGSQKKFWADTSGNLKLAGDLVIGTTGVFGSEGILRSIDAVAFTTGVGFWMNGQGFFRMGDPAAQHILFDTASLSVITDNVRMVPGGGIQVLSPSGGYSQGQAVTFSSLIYGGRNAIYGYEASNTRRIDIYNSTSVANRDAVIMIQADGTAANASTIFVDSTASNGSQVQFNTDVIRINGLPGYTGTISISGCNIFVNDGFITNSSC